MISRIYVIPKDGRTKADSYLIDSKFSKKELLKLAEALTNPILENYNLGVLPPLGGRTPKFLTRFSCLACV